MTEYTVYLLRMNGGQLYTGITNNLEKRMKEHAGRRRGSKYVRAFKSFTTVYTEHCASKSEALKREYRIKKMTKEEKEQLIRNTAPNGSNP